MATSAHRLALAGGDQHVHLATRSGVGDIAGQTQQLVGLLAHRADHDDHLDAAPNRAGDMVGDRADALGIAHRRAAELHHEEGHVGKANAADPPVTIVFAGPVASVGDVEPPQSARPRTSPSTLPRTGQAAERQPRRPPQAIGVRPRRASVVLGAMVAGFAGAISGGSNSATTTTTASTSSTTSTLPTKGVNTPIPPAGAELTGPTPCPAEDGSSPRTTTFAGPPPSCIDNDYFYNATISTTKGDLKININPHQAPGAANNFVVLSRYHYYDGQAFSVILPRESAGVQGEIDNPAGRSSPGYTLPGEVPAAGQIYVPGSIAMVPINATGDDFAAAFLLATFDQAPALPPNLTQFGIMLDGATVLQALDKASSKSGQPTEVITITGITVTQSVKIDQ